MPSRTLNFLFCTLLISAATTLHAEETLVYKKAEDRELKLLVEKPADWKASDKRPAIVYPKAQHGFFNRDPHYTLTLIETDKFLASLGWLAGEPTLEATPKE